MINSNELVKIGFTVAQATNISAFFRNIGYLTVGTDAVITGVEIPSDNVLVIDSMDTLNATLKSDSQEYQDIATVLTQNGNLNPNRGQVNNVIVYFGTLASGETYGDLATEFISVNANWSQLLINSQEDEDILSVATVCKTNNRLFVAQTSSTKVAEADNDSIAKTMATLDNDNVLLVYHTTAGESLAAGLAGIMANPYLGATGALYSTVTLVSTEDYTATVNYNLKNQHVAFYTSVNAINGGGVEQYGSPIVYGGDKNGEKGVAMINGEDAKRRYIRYCVDLLLKARCIDFLKKKLGYEDSSADVLLSTVKSTLTGCQTNGLIKKDSIVTSGENVGEKLGFDLRTVYPSELQEVDETAYNGQKYKLVGYYRDSLTGKEVDIDLYIDPNDTDKALIGF